MSFKQWILGVSGMGMVVLSSCSVVERVDVGGTLEKPSVTLTIKEKDSPAGVNVILPNLHVNIAGENIPLGAVSFWGKSPTRKQAELKFRFDTQKYVELIDQRKLMAISVTESFPNGAGKWNEDELAQFFTVDKLLALSLDTATGQILLDSVGSSTTAETNVVVYLPVPDEDFKLPNDLYFGILVRVNFIPPDFQAQLGGKPFILPQEITRDGKNIGVSGIVGPGNLEQGEFTGFFVFVKYTRNEAATAEVASVGGVLDLIQPPAAHVSDEDLGLLQRLFQQNNIRKLSAD